MTEREVILPLQDISMVHEKGRTECIPKAEKVSHFFLACVMRDVLDLE